jgi:hypothetical protein
MPGKPHPIYCISLISPLFFINTKAQLDPIVDSGFGYEVKVDCPSDGSMWRDIKVLYEYTNFTMLNRPGIHNGGLSIKSEIDVLVRCRYTISVGALGIMQTVCSNALALMRYKGPIEVDLEMSFVPETNAFVVTPDVRIWTDWNSLEPTCSPGHHRQSVQHAQGVSLRSQA